MLIKLRGFQVDLRHTDLDDFIEHFERTVISMAAHFLEHDKKLPVQWIDEPESQEEESEYVLIVPKHEGKTIRTYTVFWRKSETETLELGLALRAARYRRDQISLNFYANENLSVLSLHRFLSWLRLNWGDAVGDDSPIRKDDMQLIQDSMLPIPEGDRDYSSEEWDRIFHHIYSVQGAKPNLGKITRLLPKSYDTVKKAHLAFQDRNPERT